MIYIKLLMIITGDHSKYDLRYTQKPIYSPIFTHNIWSYLLYLLWSPVRVKNKSQVLENIVKQQKVEYNKNAEQHKNDELLKNTRYYFTYPYIHLIYTTLGVCQYKYRLNNNMKAKRSLH